MLPTSREVWPVLRTWVLVTEFIPLMANDQTPVGLSQYFFLNYHYFLNTNNSRFLIQFLERVGFQYVDDEFEANQKGPMHLPEWFVLYQAKQEYDLTDLSPKTVDDFFSRMLNDDALFQLYFK